LNDLKQNKVQAKNKKKANLDPSINEPENPEATGESDVEEDQAALDEDDMGW